MTDLLQEELDVWTEPGDVALLDEGHTKIPGNKSTEEIHKHEKERVRFFPFCQLLHKETETYSDPLHKG